MGVGGKWGGRLFEAGRLLTFSAFRMGAYSRLGAYSNKYGILQCNKPDRRSDDLYAFASLKLGDLELRGEFFKYDSKLV